MCCLLCYVLCLQFRWLQTSVFGGSAGIRDVWFMDILKYCLVLFLAEKLHSTDKAE